MKLWAKRGKWRLWEVREVSIGQLEIEKAALDHRGQSRIGIPFAYALIHGRRYYCPELAPYVQIEEEPLS